MCTIRYRPYFKALLFSEENMAKNSTMIFPDQNIGPIFGMEEMHHVSLTQRSKSDASPSIIPLSCNARSPKQVGHGTSV